MTITFILVLKLSIMWLAVAYSAANITNAAVLLFLLDKKVHFDKKELLLPVVKMLAISLLTAVSLYIPMKLLDQLVFDTTRTIGLLLLTGIATLVGISVYIFLSWLLGVKEVVVFYNLGRRILTFSKKLASPAATSIEAQEPNP